MIRRMLLVELAAFVEWLKQTMPAHAKPLIHEFEAHAQLLISKLPPDCNMPEMDRIDEPHVQAGLDWLLTTLRTAYPEGWAPLACESLRLLLHKHLTDIVSLMHPPTQEVT